MHDVDLPRVSQIFSRFSIYFFFPQGGLSNERNHTLSSIQPRSQQPHSCMHSTDSCLAALPLAKLTSHLQALPTGLE